MSTLHIWLHMSIHGKSDKKLLAIMEKIILIIFGFNYWRNEYLEGDGEQLGGIPPYIHFILFWHLLSTPCSHVPM